uniref:DUF1409 domain-containing protein n=1 Tax=Setaria viridis TaxID=4556 RepID=A0A4U6W8I8_SETVI|nr:hypothetical protein SEVIR_1G149900v2 [Setaria viridis]
MYTNILLLLQSENRVPPTHSRSGRPIEDHHPYTIFPLIGYDAPSVDVIVDRSKQARKKVTKKTSRRVRTHIEPADPPMITSAETLAALPLPAAEEVDTQVITQAGAAATSLLVEVMQEQDTPNNSLFSFAVALSDDEEVASRQVTLSSIPDDVRAKLANIRSLLQEDIGRLVEDALPIRQLFGDVSGQVLEEAEEALAPAAYIESMRIPVFRALRHMADRAKLTRAREEEDTYKLQAQEVHQWIHFLEDSCPGIVGTIDRLKRRRAELAMEMEQVTKAIDAEEKRLQELPSVVADLKQERQHLAHEALKLHRHMPEVAGLAEDDQRVLDSADQIRRRAIAAIDALLGDL